LREYAATHGISFRSNSELIESPAITKLINENIDAIQKDLANFERVRRFTLLTKPFSIEEGELTPSLKVRRKIVEEKYSTLIEGMYQGVN
jgi:long-chain acyl-CoA synthetase